MGIAFFYIFLAVVVGALGRKTMVGFWGNFIFSLFLTPLIPLIYILISANMGKKTELPVNK